MLMDKRVPPGGVRHGIAQSPDVWLEYLVSKLKDFGDQSYYEAYEVWLALEIMQDRHPSVQARITKATDLITKHSTDRQPSWRR